MSKKKLIVYSSSSKANEDNRVISRKKWIEQYRSFLNTLSSSIKRAKKTKAVSPKRAKEPKAVLQERDEEPEAIFPKRAKKSLKDEVNESLKDLLDW
jgi:hypothetical protein